jgi:hypothetical protein
MLVQLNPPIPLLTPKGTGLAHFLIDYGPEFDLHWTVFLDDSGECWTFSNRQIRAQKNITLGRTRVPPPAPANSPALDTTDGEGRPFPNGHPGGVNGHTNGTAHGAVDPSLSVVRASASD